MSGQIENTALNHPSCDSKRLQMLLLNYMCIQYIVIPVLEYYTVKKKA
jgi:hypothetical protein